jgi:(2Fe-2S) ferredoxin
MSDKTYFDLEGDFVGIFALDGYKLKYLLLRTVDRDVSIEIPKELRAGMVYQLDLGDRIRCAGTQKKFKLKASAIEKVVRVASVLTRFHGRTLRFPQMETRPERLAPVENRSARLERVVAAPANESKVKILICQKSHCLKNGGKEVYLALTEQLDSHNLNNSVTVECTGCLKLCKQAPNLVVLPVGVASALWNQSSYHNVRTSQIPAIISKVIGTDDRESIAINC